MNAQPVTITIARYKCIDADFSYETVGETTLDNIPAFVRISEPMTVTFLPVESDEQIQLHVAALDKSRAQVVHQFTEKLAEIDRLKSELLALTHSVNA